MGVGRGRVVFVRVGWSRLGWGLVVGVGVGKVKSP